MTPTYTISKTSDEILADIRKYFTKEMFTATDLAEKIGISDARVLSAKLKAFHQWKMIEQVGTTRRVDKSGRKQTVTVWKLNK